MDGSQLTAMPKGNSRRKTGSQMAELPPALIILFVLIFFPLIDFLYLCVAYGAGWYLNQIELRQVACQAPQALTATPGNNGSSGPPYSSKGYEVVLPQSQTWNGFMGVTETALPTVTYFPSADPNSPQVGSSQVTTTVSVKPFMSLPVSFPGLPAVPGMNGPVNFTYISNKTYQEEETPQPPPINPVGAAG